MSSALKHEQEFIRTTRRRLSEWETVISLQTVHICYLIDAYLSSVLVDILNREKGFKASYKNLENKIKKKMKVGRKTREKSSLEKKSKLT